MSDELEFFSEESYEFEFEDEEDDEIGSLQEGGQDSVESLYYHAKSLKDLSMPEALESFEKLVAKFNNEEATEWKFKSYKQQLKIHFKQKNYRRALEILGDLVSISPKLNGNYAEESISKLLSRYSMSPNQEFVSEMYNVIVSRLQDFMISGASGKRLWLRININRLNNLLSMDDIEACKKLIKEINAILDTVSELTRNSYALDVIAAEIMCVMRSEGSLAELSALHRRSMQMAPAIIHPRVMGVIRECGATVQFFRCNYDRARVEFFECFKNYDEAGSSSKNKVLKYLALCSLLIESEVNPFESQETQSYSQLPEFQNLIQLISAYENQDLKYYLEVIVTMQVSGDPLSEDSIFTKAQLQILHNLKVKILHTLLRAYSTIKYDFLIEKLHLKDDEELEKLLIVMANKGTGPNIKTDFIERFIECGGDESFFSAPLDSQMVTSNLKALFRLGYRGPWNSAADSDAIGADEPTPLQIYGSPREVTEVEVAKTPSNVYEMLFRNAIDHPESRIDEKEWYKYMLSLIPGKMTFSLSQKEKVISEHIKEDKEEARENQEDEEASKNTSQGLLGSTLQYEAPNLLEKKNDTHVNKLDLLQKWTYQLAKTFRYE